MISCNAEFIITKNEVKLMTRCYECNKDINVIDCIFHNIPVVLKFLPNKENPNRKVEIKLRCPECKIMFCITSLSYYNRI